MILLKEPYVSYNLSTHIVGIYATTNILLIFRIYVFKIPFIRFLMVFKFSTK
jgi:hypothetical protein